MGRKVLVTGGAGFVGSHVADALLARGDRVRALDSLASPAHRAAGPHARDLDPEVDLVVGDLRDRDAVRRALDGVDAVVHLAARVGAGDGVGEALRYVDDNAAGTAVLLEALAERPVERLVLASSACVYGEGLYRTAEGRAATAPPRSLDRLRAGDFEARDGDGRPLLPLPTPETWTPALPSMYAASKFAQEAMCRVAGRAAGVSTVVLRLFNTYGPRQHPHDPYASALWSAVRRALRGEAPRVPEDGGQKRDFVSVHDVVQAFLLALDHPAAPGGTFNVASGRRFTLLEAARAAAAAAGRPGLVPEPTLDHRPGDVRHCFADVSRARTVLGYGPLVALEDGLGELAAWIDEGSAPSRAPRGGDPRERESWRLSP